MQKQLKIIVNIEVDSDNENVCDPNCPYLIEDKEDLLYDRCTLFDVSLNYFDVCKRKLFRCCECHAMERKDQC